MSTDERSRILSVDEIMRAPVPDEWDDAAFELHRKEIGHNGTHLVRLLPGRPMIEVDLTAAKELVLLGKIGNPIIDDAIAAFREHNAKVLGNYLEKRRALGNADDDEDEDDDTLDDDSASNDPFASAQTILEWQDSILTLLIVKPKWCPIKRIPRGLRPPGELCIFDFTAEQRQAACNLALAGVEGLRTFRETPAGYEPALPSEDVRADAEPDAHPALPDASEVLARRSDTGGSERDRVTDAQESGSGGSEGRSSPERGEGTVALASVTLEGTAAG